MKVSLEAGRFVVAVSGGVDSVCLLDLLVKQKDLELVVAHFDHGTRENSKEDMKFVEELAKKYSFAFETKEGRLGEKAGEELARKARYEFLRQVCKKYKAKAIITAHHQDDVLETIIFNVIRGTGRKGITSLDTSGDIKRPLLKFSKKQIIAYAQENDLKWREDPTNSSLDYSRNWIRHMVIPKLTEKERQELISYYKKQKPLNKEIDNLLSRVITKNKDKRSLNRSVLLGFSYGVACEVVAHWLRDNAIKDFDKKTIERIVHGAKTLRSGKQIKVQKNSVVKVGSSELWLEKGEN